MRTETVRIPVDDGPAMEGTLVASSGAPLPAVLFVHGWGGSKDQSVATAREVAERGFVCLTFNLRGHGETDALHKTVARPDNIKDVVAAYELLAGRRDVDRARIAVVGASYGAYLAAIVSLRCPFARFALRAPALYKDDNWDMPKHELHVDPDFKEYRRRSLRTEDNRALGACAQFRGDVLLVESGADEIIPHPAIANYIAAFVNAHSLTYRVIEGADHGLTQAPWQRAYDDLLVDWLSTISVDTARTVGLA
ncbi:MAG TPA: alpha/beta fold hydrolase [Burkholderiales bacterium]|nr:alpha/beta fold hydrolase [Burkholderiales bacterium]